jgi:hypothetical protein
MSTESADAERLADGLARTLAGHFAANSIPTWETIHAAARELGEVRALYAEITRLQQERDLAIAHDRQPYPTAQAYELACKQRDAATREAEALKTEAVAWRDTAIGWENQAEALRDDPQWDATDAAHPAWWRGHDHTTAVFCHQATEILDGKEPGGVSQEPWETLRRRLWALREEVGRLRARIGAPHPVNGLECPGDGCRGCQYCWSGTPVPQEVVQPALSAPAQPSADDASDYPDPGPALKRALLRSSRLIAEKQPSADDAERAREIYDKQVEPWQRSYSSSMSYVDYRQRGIELIAAALTAAREQGRAEGAREQRELDVDAPALDQCPACYWHPGHEPDEWFREEAALRGYILPVASSGQGDDTTTNNPKWPRSP